jgi:nucleoside-diphosphate-sugar epimerase
LQLDVVLDMDLATAQNAWTVTTQLRGLVGRLVVPSSIDVYRAHGRINGREPGPPDPGPLTEDAPLRERLYPYRELADAAPDEERRKRRIDYDKILVEKVVLTEPALPATVLRLPMVYGPGDYQHRLWPYLKRMDDGRPAIILDDVAARWVGARGYVENVADAIVTACEDARGDGRVYNVVDDGAPTEAEWVAAVARAAGWNGRLVVIPKGDLPEQLADGHEQQWEVDASKLRRELGWQPRVGLADALAATVAWERVNPPEEPGNFDYALEDEVLARCKT